MSGVTFKPKGARKKKPFWRTCPLRPLHISLLCLTFLNMLMILIIAKSVMTISLFLFLHQYSIVSFSKCIFLTEIWFPLPPSLSGQFHSECKFSIFTRCSRCSLRIYGIYVKCLFAMLCLC